MALSRQERSDLIQIGRIECGKVHQDRGLVRRNAGDETTKGGLIIPDTTKEKPQEGEVVCVGAGGRRKDGERIPMEVKAADRILFGKWSGSEIKLDGEEMSDMGGMM